MYKKIKKKKDFVASSNFNKINLLHNYYKLSIYILHYFQDKIKRKRGVKFYEKSV